MGRVHQRRIRYHTSRWLFSFILRFHAATEQQEPLCRDGATLKSRRKSTRHSLNIKKKQCLEDDVRLLSILHYNL
jgi:hypothetical protein